MTLREVVGKTVQYFKDHGIETARLDAELLISACLGWDRIQLYMQLDYPLDESQLSSCRESVRRRALGEPVAYILGYRDFFKSRFRVNKDVLIPRPETEGVVELALEKLKPIATESSTCIVDLGCGSGCIGLSLIKEWPSAQLLAVDISTDAIRVAEWNAEALSVAGRARFRVADAAVGKQWQADSFGASQVDLVVMNPPYIAHEDKGVEANVLRFEPSMALFAGDRGLRAIKEWSVTAAEVLRPGGWLITEIGYNQGAEVSDFLRQSALFIEVEVKQDYSGKDRVVAAKRNPGQRID